MIKIAIAYDFDGTLAKGNIQENSFIPSLDISKKEFWEKVKELSEENNMDEILSYMFLLIDKANKNDITVKKEDLKKHGKDVTFFNGVETFFGRINKFAEEQGVILKHYIISSGTKEMIEGTAIANEFENIYASSFMYDKYGKPIWPALAINYTTKTQYIYRINKGISNAWDNKLINKYIPEHKRDIVFENIIYLGDGETDIPAMTLLKSKGGKSIAVYDEKLEIAQELLKQDRVNYIAKADYSEGKEIDTVIKSIIASIANISKLEDSYGKRSINEEQSEKENTSTTAIAKKSETEEYLNILNTEGFKTKSDTTINKIYLKKDEWNDHRYQTSFYMWNNGEYLGVVKIASKDQQIDKHTSEKLPEEFEKLPDDFISKIQSFRDDNLSDKQKEALKYLLNDITDTAEFDNTDVVKKSLKRDIKI